MKKVLILAYFYPPVGGAGVQRIVKFIKYLPDYGFSPVVVAGTGEESLSYAPNDDVLCKDVKNVCKYDISYNSREEFFRSLARSKGRKFIPGTRHGWWCSAAERKCDEIIEAEKPDIIFVSCSPFYAAKVAQRVAARSGLPWVLDMRDPWAYDPYLCYPTKFHFYLEKVAMKNACLSANAVIMNTPRSLAVLQQVFPQLPNDKLFCITNGWDKADFDSVRTTKTVQNNGVLTIVHTGHFQTSYAIKTDPAIREMLGGGGRKFKDNLRYFNKKPYLLARTPYYFFKGVRKALDEKNIDNKDLRLIFAGNLSKEDLNLINKFNLEKMVELKGYINHYESLNLLCSADVLFLPLHGLQKKGFPLIVPGKTYEYMATRKPILGFVPPGDARDFIRQSGLGFICDPTNVEQIAQALLDLIEKNRNYSLVVNPNDQFIQQFERRRLTEKLAEVFGFAISSYRSKYAD